MNVFNHQTNVDIHNRLAKAVKAEKREQPQKKPSILKKLDEYKKQAAQQPKDKQKEHKKDLEV